MKLFPVPTGPQIRYPIGALSNCPRRIARASDSSRFLAASCPATASSVSRGSMNSTSPWQLRSIRSFFRAANSAPSGAEPSRAASLITPRRLSSVSPPDTAAIRRTAAS